eukprot:794760-Pyramimonas_sp.AAC.1
MSSRPRSLLSSPVRSTSSAPDSTRSAPSGCRPVRLAGAMPVFGRVAGCSIDVGVPGTTASRSIMVTSSRTMLGPEDE